MMDEIWDDEYDPDWQPREPTPEERDAMPPRVIAYIKLPGGVMAEITVDGWNRMHSSDPRITPG